MGRARIYVCGITPYDTTHLGHAATFVWSDVVARLLHHVGVAVDLCRNITDVDDDMLDQARAQGVPWRSLATQQTYRFEEDMRRLGLLKPTFEPQSHSYVDEVVALAQALVEGGAAYERGGGVYFRGRDVPARAGIDGSEALDRLAGTTRPGWEDADDPLDVPVWQRSLEGEPTWPSPWGPGRPGWHAECASMALAALGTGIDVHGGGADLAFPHHAYEAAMAEAVTGVSPFARAWLHVGMVMTGGEKMAKSKGNLVFVHDLLEEWPAGAIRLLLLDRRWDREWELDTAALDAAAARVDRLRGLATRAGMDGKGADAVVDALLDDLDAPRALDLAEEAAGPAAAAAGSLLGLF